MWADRRAVSQPNPSVCLCANAVLKWAHYHQREHKHSSRKQDSLCQEREPLPQAHCRPDEITRLKIRQGSYYYCRHAPQAASALRCRRRQSTQLLKHSLSSLFSDCGLCFSPVALRVCCKLQEVQGVFLVRAQAHIQSLLLSFAITVSAANFDAELCRDGDYHLVEIQQSQISVDLPIMVLFMS